MSSAALRGALGLVCAAGFGLSAAFLFDRNLRVTPAARDERLLRRVLDALAAAVPQARRFTVTAHAGRVMLSGPVTPGDEARILDCLRALDVHAMQLSVSEPA
ncbi:MAG: hypothetical protein M3Z37_02005 [Candidatus Eremiobacteraeota bacterium]|nr:hypothetical protein [Candidatus Eremiobacteraeota bacterium]